MTRIWKNYLKTVDFIISIDHQKEPRHLIADDMRIAYGLKQSVHLILKYNAMEGILLKYI